MLLTLTLLKTVFCIFDELPLVTVRGEYVDNTVGNHMFDQFDYSQDLCRELWKPWWDEYKVLRLTADLHEILGPEGPSFPNIPVYDTSPVQSIGAKIGSFFNPRPYSHGDHYDEVCNFACEDQRSEMELLISQVSNKDKVQARFFFAVHMRCRYNHEAYLVYEHDDREIPTAEYLEHERKFKEWNPILNSFLGFEEFPRRGRLGDLVTRCRCRPKQSHQMYRHAFPNKRQRMMTTCEEIGSGVFDGSASIQAVISGWSESV